MAELIKIGDIGIITTPFKVYRVRTDNLDVCDSNGTCVSVSKQAFLINTITEETMKAMKDAVLTVAKGLLKANNTVTTLEIKTELRRDYPYYFWTQQAVSDYMSQLAGDGLFTYIDNGTYRTYSAVQPVATVSKTVTSATVTGGIGTNVGFMGKRGRQRTANVITIKDVPSLAAQKNFEGVTINRSGTPTFYTLKDIRIQKKSPISYIARSLSKVLSITLGGTTFVVK